MDSLTKAIELWSAKRNLHKGQPRNQFLKVVEEVGEVAGAMARNDEAEIIDGIGDVYVTLVILAQQHGLSIEECVRSAYSEIAQRNGKIVDGIFIKEEEE